MPQLSDLDLEALEVAARNGYVPVPEKTALILAEYREMRRQLHELAEMPRRMPTRAGVYALGCDETGLWLLDPTGEWFSGVILEDDEPHKATERVLAEHGAGGSKFHQTSVRTILNAATGRSSQVNTFLAAVPIRGLVNSEWPLAEPITREVMAEWGPPIPHASDEPPIVNDANVLMHGLRHFKWLSNPKNDATRARDLAELGWTPHLEPFEEDLARMFRQVHVAA